MKTWKEYEAENEGTMGFHEMIRAYNGEYFRDNAEAGDGATVHLYSDSNPYTIIKRTAKTLTLRRCKATRKETFIPKWIPGGFSAICTNIDEQEWDIAEDEKGVVEKAYWSEAKGGFYVGGCLHVTPGRYKYYDYNF